MPTPQTDPVLPQNIPDFFQNNDPVLPKKTVPIFFFLKRILIFLKKRILIFLSSAIFDTKLDALNIIGYSIAFIGVMAYKSEPQWGHVVMAYIVSAKSCWPQSVGAMANNYIAMAYIAMAYSYRPSPLAP